ncbi:rab-GTPase-TBC domain-containing protein [Jimgerdemannia flammicorona]|uniref:Rab-GTPase-TBC domain-containing protein n=1 Tax=Jimgerdemannia flammicorona TaxID=994334 RepID=A0A433A0G1_9FUNG|nr:rab-GTPase-TBC domain-containing protein [Jimgerdemannia flammicorona]
MTPASFNGKILPADRVKSIHDAIVANDIEQLRTIARSEDGLMCDWLRRQAWPILLHSQEGIPVREVGSEQDLRDPIQISKDVERSLYYFPQGTVNSHLLLRICTAIFSYDKPTHRLSLTHTISFPPPDLSTPQKVQRRRELHEMIIEILWHNPNLHYYQGFHDVCTTFLLVLGKRLAIPAAENVAMFFLRDIPIPVLTLARSSKLIFTSTDGMLDSIDPVSRQLSLVTTLLKLENPGLHEFLMNANIMPFYTLSWVLTWFSHDLTDFDKVMRLFDLFMASTPLMPIYVACAIVLSHGQELLLQEPEMVHMYLVNLPQDPDMDIDEIIQMAIVLEKKYPPMDLQKRSGTWLDECSPVNTYETEWRCLDADTHPDRIAAEQCLTMPPRRMMEPRNPESRKRRPSLWERLSGGLVV